MRAFAALSVLLVFTGQALAQTTTPTGNFFDCRREGIDCTDGTCNPSTFVTCSTCASGFNAVSPFVCKADATFPAGQTCVNAAQCKNGASCRPDNTPTDVCFCTDDWTGATCEEPRIKLTCDNTGMTIVVTPWSGTTTLGYPEGKIADTNCEMTYDAGAGTQTATYDYVDTNSCGVVTGDDGAGGITYTIKLITQYTAAYVQYTDQLLTAKCTFPVTGSVSSTFTADAAGTLDPGTGDLDATPLTLAVIDPGTSSAPSGAVTVGTPLNLVVTFDSTHTGWQKILVKTCTVGNMLADDSSGNYKSIDIVESDGCPSANQVVRANHATDSATATANTVTIPFYAFMFLQGSSSNTGSLFFGCTVQLCSGTTLATCDAPGSCTGTYTTGYGRRKRSAESGSAEGAVEAAGLAGGPETHQLTQSIKVRIGNATIEEEFESGAGSGQRGSEVSDCLANPGLQSVLAVLGLVVILALLALVATACLYCRARTERDAHVKYVDNPLSMGSSTQTLHIPRPAV